MDAQERMEWLSKLSPADREKINNLIDFMHAGGPDQVEARYQIILAADDKLRLKKLAELRKDLKERSPMHQVLSETFDEGQDILDNYLTGKKIPERIRQYITSLIYANGLINTFPQHYFGDLDHYNAEIIDTVLQLSTGIEYLIKQGAAAPKGDQPRPAADLESPVDGSNKDSNQMFLIAHEAAGNSPDEIRFLFKAGDRYLLGTIKNKNGSFSYGTELVGELQAFQLWKHELGKHDVDLHIAFPDMVPFLGPDNLPTEKN